MGIDEKLKSRLEISDKLYPNNLSIEELVLLKSYLLILRSEGHLENFIGLRQLSYRREKTSEGAIFKIYLQDIYKKHIRSIINKASPTFVEKLMESYLEIDNEQLTKHLPEMFDYQLDYFLNYRGKYGEGELQPKELTQLMQYFLPKGGAYKLYNPFAGLASLAINLPSEVEYFGQEINEITWYIGALRLKAHSCPDTFRFLNGNSLQYWKHYADDQFDHIIFNPPFKLRLSAEVHELYNESPFASKLDANALIISETYEKLKENGKLIFLINDGFLFSGAKREKELRKMLVLNTHIEAIIALPPGVLKNTSISITLVIVSKKQNKKIKFIDARNLHLKKGRDVILDTEKVIELYELGNHEDVRDVEVEKVKKNDFILSVNHYVIEELNLNEVERSSLRSFRKFSKVIPQKRKKIERGRLVRIKDLSATPNTSTNTFETVSISDLPRNAAVLESDALLVSLNGLESAYFKRTDFDIYYHPVHIRAFEIDTAQVSPEYLISELSKDYVEAQFKRYYFGSAIRRIHHNDIKKIEIVVPTLEEQIRSVEEYKRELISTEQSRLQDLIKEYGIDVADENSFLRHLIGGRLKSVRGAFGNLKSILENQIIPNRPEILSLKADDRLETTLKDYLEILDRDIKSITDTVIKTGDSIGLEEDIQFEKIDIIKFINTYVKELENRREKIFSIQINQDEVFLETNNITRVFIDGDKNSLRKMFDNIIENAEKHAFLNQPSPNNKIQIDFIYTLEYNDVQIDFSNNGMPLPKNFNHEVFTRRGHTLGRHSGDGIGGWYINEVMKNHNGELGITDELSIEGIGGDIVTSIELTFPVEFQIK